MLCDRGRGFLNAVSCTGHAHASSCMRVCDLRHGADGKYNNAQARARIENRSPGYWVCRGGVMNDVNVWMCIIMIMYITCACVSLFRSLLLGAVRPAPALLETAVAATDSSITCVSSATAVAAKR